ncbi:MAG: hypothetical protein RL757_732 [Bacteroidota bacterium]|jgi:hypothetical protein
MNKKIIFLLLLFRINNLDAQDVDDQRWNISVGVLPFRQEILNAGFDNQYLDFICNLKLEHKITKKTNIGLSYYQLLRAPVITEYNYYIISVFSKYQLYKKKWNWFVEPHLGFGSIYEDRQIIRTLNNDLKRLYLVLDKPQQYYFGLGTGISYPFSQHFSLAFSVKSFYRLTENPMNLLHTRPFLNLSYHW